MVVSAAGAHGLGMRYTLLIALLLAGCGASNRTDGVTPGEAAALNAAAEKLDVESESTAR